MSASHDQQKIRNPIYDTPKGVYSPIYYLDESINDTNRFIITRYTDNGAYVRGNLIFYSLNGVEIYTELSNAIYVDLINKTATIKEFSKAVEEPTKKENPEERQYVLLLVPRGYQDVEDPESLCSWAALMGRTNTYNYIKDNIESLDFDPKRSLVITANVAFKDSFTISQFIDFVKNSNMVPEDDFDIHWYEEDEGEEIE